MTRTFHRHEGNSLKILDKSCDLILSFFILSIEKGEGGRVVVEMEERGCRSDSVLVNTGSAVLMVGGRRLVR